MLPCVFLMGPTAVGKTRLAIELAQQLPLALISVDSMLVYRGLDVGTGKPSAVTLARAPHALIDVCAPDKPYSVAQFCEDVARILPTIPADKIPFFVGGTPMYFNALQYGLSTLPSANAAIRAKLAQHAEKVGWPALHRALTAVDPARAAQIVPTDPQRISRALEVYELTGQPMSWHLQQARSPIAGRNIKAFNLLPEARTALHAAIATRFGDMLREGFVDEVAALRRAGLSTELPALRAVGYRQIHQHLEGFGTYEEMCDKAIAATRQLAKRQITWFGKWSNSVSVLNTLPLKNQIQLLKSHISLI